MSLYVTMPPVSRSKLYEPAQLWLERPRAGGLRWRSGARSVNCVSHLR